MVAENHTRILAWRKGCQLAVMLAMIVSWFFATNDLAFACGKTGMSALEPAGNHERRVPVVRLEYARGELRVVVSFGEFFCQGPECRPSNKMSHTPIPTVAATNLIAFPLSGHDELMFIPTKISGRFVSMAVGSRLDGYLGLAEKPPRFGLL